MSDFTWIQDHNIIAVGGGAQLTDKTHFMAGLKRGHDIVLHIPEAGPVVIGKRPTIVSNATAFSPPTFAALEEQGVPCVWFLHDYWPLCKLRLFYPMQPKCRNCASRQTWLPIIAKARLIIWLSPLHRRAWLWAWPELRNVPYTLCPSPVPDTFHDMGEARHGAVAVESLYPFKGRARVLDFARQNPNLPMTFVGGNPPGLAAEPLPSNCTDIGEQPYYRMNTIYNQHRFLVHLPTSPSPFDRTVAEAYMAGCEVIGNRLVGALSWPFFKVSRERVRQELQRSPERFWEAVEGAIA